MANSEHLAKLMEGVEEWNAWREKNPGIIADLDEAPFWQINHKGANLRGADLREADLREANLREAEFKEASLQGADLRMSDTVARHLNLQQVHI